MSTEDVVQFQDVAWIDATVTGTVVVINAKAGPVVDVTAPANGTLVVTLAQEINTIDFSYNATFAQDVPLLSCISAQTDLQKTFKVSNFPANTVRDAVYRVKMILRRKL